MQAVADKVAALKNSHDAAGKLIASAVVYKSHEYAE